MSEQQDATPSAAPTQGPAADWGRVAEDRTVSPQQIILRLIDAEMAREKDGPHG